MKSGPVRLLECSGCELPVRVGRALAAERATLVLVRGAGCAHAREVLPALLVACGVRVLMAVLVGVY